MAAEKPLSRLISHVILDLDGTLLNTDGIMEEVMREFLVKYGKRWDHRSIHRILGKTPLEASNAIVEDFHLPCSADEFMSAVTPMFSEQPGVMSGKAAGMEVVAVPSIPKQAGLYSSADVVINSLLDLKPEKWGLPPFEDWVENTLPTEPWYMGGPVIKGYGRGSKVLGIPRANLSVGSFTHMLAEQVCGVYFGWAGLSTRGIYKMVMSVGWNPYFDNNEKTIEPWLLHEFDEDFYGEEMRLVILGYIRPEASFPSLESLIARIHEDRRIAEKALELPLYAGYTDSPFLKNTLQLTYVDD